MRVYAVVTFIDHKHQVLATYQDGELSAAEAHASAACEEHGRMVRVFELMLANGREVCQCRPAIV